MLVVPQYTTRKPSSYVLVTYQDSDRKEEADLAQCKHCGFHWFVKPGSGIQRGYCYQCGGRLCGKPGCLKECVPLMRAIERMEARDKLVRAMRG